MNYKPNIRVLSIDFDDTIVYTDWPNIKGLRKGAKKYITKLYNKGYKIVINTCRSGETQDDATRFLNDNNIPYHHINCNCPHLIDIYKTDSRKISACMYIDDKNILGILPWWLMYYIIIFKIKLK